MNDEIVPELAWQMGRPIRFGGEKGGLEERCRYMASIAAESLHRWGAREAPATFTGWVAIAGTKVAEAAGDVAGAAAGGILGGLLTSPIGLAALAGLAAWAVLKETT
jgi:hypothetical protein